MKCNHPHNKPVCSCSSDYSNYRSNLWYSLQEIFVAFISFFTPKFFAINKCNMDLTTSPLIPYVKVLNDGDFIWSQVF